MLASATFPTHRLHAKRAAAQRTPEPTLCARSRSAQYLGTDRIDRQRLYDDVVSIARAPACVVDAETAMARLTGG